MKLSAFAAAAVSAVVFFTSFTGASAEKSRTPEDISAELSARSVYVCNDGWTHKYGDKNGTLKFTLTGRFVYLIYEENNWGDYGKAHITVTKDGEVYDEFDLDPVDKSGWGNPQTKCIGMSAKNAEYEIEITMADGEDDRYFSVLGLAYTAD